MNAVGGLLKVIGMLLFAICGIWGFFLCIGIISKAAGFWGVVGALILGPITFAAAPLYAGFAWGDWFPFILNYGGGVAAMVLFAIGSAFAKD